MKVTYNGVELDLGDIASDFNAKGIEYLLAYGFAQSLQDSVAGVKKEMKDEGASDDEIATAIKETMQERANAIASGTVGHRVVGPRGSAIETVMRQVALAELTAAFKKKNAKLPKAKDTVTVGGKPFTRTELVAAYVAKHGERLRQEAERRQADAEAEADIEL